MGGKKKQNRKRQLQSASPEQQTTTHMPLHANATLLVLVPVYQFCEHFIKTHSILTYPKKKKNAILKTPKIHPFFFSTATSKKHIFPPKQQLKRIRQRQINR